MAYIYLITNIDNNPNNVYIGKSINKIWRKHAHNRTYGKNIVYSIIDEINSSIWEEIESYWIEQFKCWGFNVQNKNNGGGGVKKHSYLTKIKMKRTMSEYEKILRSKPRINKEGFYQPKPWKQIPILQLDKQGNIIKEWSCAYKASKQLNINYLAINNTLKRRAKTSGGFIWQYK